MADVSYSVSTLAQLGREMSTLSEVVLDEPAMTDVDVLHLACAEVVGALQEFEDDWATQRQTLASNLEAGGKLAGEAATSFSEADRLLAEGALAGQEQ